MGKYNENLRVSEEVRKLLSPLGKIQRNLHLAETEQVKRKSRSMTEI
jgi:hypothetical protein